MPNRFQPALLGGAFIGVLSALPFVSAGNACCCLWIILGGVITAYLMQQNHTEPITLGDGAVGGFVAGLIGAGIFVLVSIPFSLLLAPMQRQLMDGWFANNPEVPPAMRDWIASASGGMLSIVLSFTFMLVAGVIFGTLGGVIGAAIFKKNPPPPGTVEVLPPS